jgi:hypothetical protein
MLGAPVGLKRWRTYDLGTKKKGAADATFEDKFIP